MTELLASGLGWPDAIVICVFVICMAALCAFGVWMVNRKP
jgi:hypothetical protein